LDPDALHVGAELLEVIDGKLGGVERTAGGGIDARHPELAEVALVGLHRMADIGGAVAFAAHIDKHRKVAAHADRVEMVEEEEAVAAEEVLDIVLGGEDDRV